MSVQRIASRYAKSLIQLAEEQGKLDRVREDLLGFSRALAAAKDLGMLMKSPIVKGDKKMAVVKQLFEGQFDPLTMQFFEVLTRKNRERLLPALSREFERQYRHIKGISTVVVHSAVPLPEQVIKHLEEKLKGAGKVEQHIELETRVDPKLLGGFVLEFEDNVYDASVQRRLEELRKAFEDNLYVSKIIAH